MIEYKIDISEERSGHPAAVAVASKLRGDILTGKIKKGQKLVEKDLCEKYGTGRTAVREALKQLEVEGLVESILNRGAFAIGLSEKDFEDLYDLRKIHEIQAARWAIERITDEEMEALEETFEFMESYTFRGEADKMETINSGFHHIIYKAAKNRILENQLLLLEELLSYHDSRFEKDRAYLDEILEEHRAIFQAFGTKSARDAVEAMEAHMNKSRERHITE